MAISSTIEPSADEQGNLLANPIHSYDDWKVQYSNDDSQTFEEKLPSYVDYLRTSFFNRGELTKDVEISLQEFYADQIIGDKEVSDEEYYNTVAQSTSYNRTLDDDASLVRALRGDEAANQYLNSSDSEKLKASNEARESLLATGDISYASILQDDMGIVRSGNYSDQSTVGDKRFQAEKSAIDAYKKGYLDPRDLWQVSEGLNDSGVGGLTNFQARQDDELLAILGKTLSEEAKDGETNLNDAISSLIDVDGYRESQVDPEADILSRVIQEFRAEDPTKIDQVVLDKLPESLDMVQDSLVEKFLESRNLTGVAAEAQISGRLKEQDTYSKERVGALIKELAVRHANLQGAFKFFEDPQDDKRNIRVTEMGSVIAHPTLMGQKDRFESAVESDERLTDKQKKVLREQREIYMQGRVKSLDELFTDFDAVNDQWEAAKARNPSGFAKEPVAFVDDFLSKSANYKSVKNKMDGVKSSVKDSIFGIIHTIGAVAFESETSAQYIVDHQKKESRRRELANLFGKSLGTGYDIATTVAPMLTDIGVTAMLTIATGYGGAAYASAKAGAGLTARATSRGMMKALTGSLLYQSPGQTAKETAETLVTKKLIEKSGVDGATAAIKSFNKIVQDRFVINSNLFLTSATRSTGGMYGTIYGSLPDDMSHEEKHDKALGHSLLAGVVTGTIVSGMSAIGRGGVENILLRDMSYGSMKNILQRISRVELSDGTLNEVLKKHIKDRSRDILKKRLPTGLFRNAVNEGFEEGLDQFVNAFVEDSALDRKTPLKDKIMQAFHAAQIGAVMGASVPALGKGKQLINKVRGASYVDPDIFRGQEVERAVSALQAAGSPLSAAELRKQLSTAARASSKPGDVPPPKQPLPTTVEPKEPPKPEQGNQKELPTDLKKSLFEQMEMFLEDPANVGAPIIPPQFLNSALKDPDLYLSKGGVILGVKNSKGEWIGKSPEDSGVPPVDLGSTTVPVGTPQKDLPSGTIGGFGFSRLEENQPITVTPEELITEKGVRKAVNQWLKVNKDKLNKFGITTSFRTSTKAKYTQRSSFGISPNGEPYIRWDVNLPLTVVANQNIPANQRLDKFYEVIAEELIHSNESVLLRDDYAKDTSGRFVNWVDYAQYQKSKFVADMTPEQVARSMSIYMGTTVETSEVKPFHEELVKVISELESSKGPGSHPKLGRLRTKFNEKFGMKLPSVGAEFTRQIVQLKKEGISTETYKGRTIPASIISFVNRVIEFTKSMIKGVEFDPKTQSVVLEHVYAVEKQMANFWGYNLEEQLSKNKRTPESQIDKAVEDEINNPTTNVEEDYSSYGTNYAVLNPDIDTSIIESSRNSSSDLDTEETEQRLVEMINSAKYASGTFGIDLQVDETPTAEKGAFWSEGENIYVNPYGLHELIDGLRDEDAKSEIESEIVRQSASVASYRNISQTEIDNIVNATSDSDYTEIIKSLPEAEQLQSQERLANPQTAKAEKERLVEQRMNDFGSRLLRGHTVQDDRIFFQGNPGWVATTIYFLEGMLNRVWSAREIRKQNPYLTTGIQRMVGELRAMKGGYRIPNNTMSFDRNRPEATMLALKDIIEEEDATMEVSDMAEMATEEPKAPFRIKNVLDTLEVPVFETGAYKKPPKWLSWLTGKEDERLRRLNEMRTQYGRMVNKEIKEYKVVFDKLIKDTYGSYKLAPIDLIAAATGSTRGKMIDDETRELIDSDHREAVDLINREYADRATERDVLLLSANEAKKTRIKFEEEVKAAQINKAREDALALIARDSPELSEHLKTLRGKVDDLSEQIRSMTGKQSPNMAAHIDNQLGIYLTRSYKIFSDENWIDDVLNKEEYRELRESVKVDFIDYLKKEEAASLFEKYEFQFLNNREAQWNKLSYTSKMQQVQIEAAELIAKREKAYATEGQNYADVIMEDFLSKYKKGFWDNQSPEIENRTVDVLRRKKNLPKFMLKLLGEYEGDTGDFNLMRTFVNVGSLASNLSMINNMVTVGRRGSKEDWWFLTKKELDVLRAENPQKYEEWTLVNKPKKVGHEVGTMRFDPTRNFVDNNGVDQGPLFASPEFTKDFDAMMKFRESLSDADSVAAKLDAPLRRLTGMALGAKTLGSVPFYIRNIVSNVLFFGPAQGVMPLGKMFGKRDNFLLGGTLREELERKLSSPKGIDDYSSKLIKLGVLDNELTSSLLDALKKGKYAEEDILSDMNKYLNEAAKSAGIPDLENASAKEKSSFLAKVKAGGVSIKSSTWDASMDKLRALSEVVDSFYKIAYYESELQTMKKAKEAAKAGDPILNMTEANLEQEAARKIKMTAQSYSQAPPIVAGMQNSVYGVLFSPYFRFKLEVPRIMVNTYKLGIEEMKSKNSVIALRGARRLFGMNAMVVGFSMLAKSLGEKAVVGIINAFGGDAEDDDLTQEQENIIRMGSPDYLRSHTFYYYKLKNELYSLDLTYVNPFAMYADAFPRAWEHLARGDEGAAISSFVDTLVSVPFLDGQIAFTSLMQAKNNQDADGNPLWRETESAYAKMWKATSHVFMKAYSPPTLERLSKLAASEDASREELFETPYGLLLKELVPFRPYKVDPSQIKYRIMKDLSDDTNMLEADLRSILTGKLLSQEQIEDIAIDQVDGNRTIGEVLKRVYTPLRELGVSVEEMEEAIQRMMNKEQFSTLINENAMLLKTITPSMQKILEESDQEDIRERYLAFERKIYEQAPDGKVYLSED